MPPTPGKPPAATASLHNRLSTQIVGLLLRDPHLRFRLDRLLRERHLKPLHHDDFPAEPHRLIFQAVLDALEQDARDPQDEVQVRLSYHLQEEADRCLAATAHMHNAADQWLEALFQAVLRLRRLRVDDGLSEVRFLLTSAEETDDQTSVTTYQQRLMELLQCRALLDRALKAGFHATTQGQFSK